MKKMTKNQSLNTKGFTILELLIATTVLSVILVLSTAMLIGIGRLYQKGLSQSRAQSTSRTIVDEVTNQLQLVDNIPMPGTSPSGNVRAYCIGNTRYSYVLNTPLGREGSQSRHVLWRDDFPSAGCSDPVNLPDDFLNRDIPSEGGVELMSGGSQLRDFTVTGTSPYSLSMTIAYGPADLLTGSGVDTRCIADRGNEYCGTASLSTTVARRIVD